MEYKQPIPTTLTPEDFVQAVYGSLENSDDGFLIVDTDGLIAYINEAYSTYLGKKRIDMVGKPVLDFIDTSTLVDAANNPAYPCEKAVLHRVSDNQYSDGEHYCIVNRTNVSKSGRNIAGCGQIHFVRSTIQLSSSIREIYDQMSYYKEELERLSAEKYSLDNICGDAPSMKKAKEMVLRSSDNDFPVLITGETGTGKEVFANAVHYSSIRKSKPFIRINCAAIPPTLFESELFGYESGAFTGAKKSGKKGKFELANHGTLFLDEIGDMPLEMQAKLLRVLQEKEVERIGGERPIPIDVRIIAATNKNLPQEIKEKHFRADLYFRLNVISIVVPPLRDHAEDIDDLIDTFISRLNEEYHSKVAVTDEARQILRGYSWPGNIRELKNVIERCFVLQENGIIHTHMIPATILSSMEKKSPAYKGLQQTGDQTLAQAMDEFEKEFLMNAIRAHDGNLQATAKRLGIHRVTLYKKLEKYGLKREDF